MRSGGGCAFTAVVSLLGVWIPQNLGAANLLMTCMSPLDLSTWVKSATTLLCCFFSSGWKETRYNYEGLLHHCCVNQYHYYIYIAFTFDPSWEIPADQLWCTLKLDNTEVYGMLMYYLRVHMVHTYIPIYLHTYICTYIRHRYIITYMQGFMCSIHADAWIHECRYT